MLKVNSPVSLLKTPSKVPVPSEFTSAVSCAASRLALASTIVFSSGILSSSSSQAGKASTLTLNRRLKNIPGRLLQSLLLKRSEERSVGKECVSSVDLGGHRFIKQKNVNT